MPKTTVNTPKDASILDVALALSRLQYLITPIVPGSKAASGRGWQGLRITTEAKVRQYIQAGYGIGLLTGIESSDGAFPVGIDIDIDDDILIDRIRLAFPETPPGKRGKKGVTFFARTAEQTRKRLIKRKDDAGRMQNCVEILAAGQQTVLPPTIHPDTNLPYEWVGPPLTDYAPKDLPELTPFIVWEIEQAVTRPEAPIFLLNEMEASDGKHPGTVHNSTLSAVAQLINCGFDDGVIWARVRLASERIMYDAEGWEEAVLKMCADARSKGFDKKTGKKASSIQNAAQWLLNDWLGEGRVLHRDGTLAVYRGGYYETLMPSDLCHIVAREYDGGSFEAAQYENIVSTAIIRAPRFPVTETKKVCFRNGTLDMNTSVFTDWSPDDYLMSQLPFDYDPEAETSIYDRIIDRAFSGNGDDQTDKSIACFEEFVAHTFFECLDYHKFLVIKGQPRTGKSTLINIVKSMHPKTAWSTVPITSFGDERYRTAMVGKLLNIVSEVETTTHTADSFLKSVTGGDDVTVRFLYKEPQNVRLAARIIVACNELFKVRDTSGAIEARMLLLSCDNFLAPTDRDPHLITKLVAERPGIFNRMLAAWEGLRDHGIFTEPSSMEEMKAEFSLENNNVMQWLQQRTNEGTRLNDMEYVKERLAAGMEKSAFCENSLLYLDYVDWAKLNGFKQMSSITFGMKISQIKSQYPLKSLQKWVGGRPVKGRFLTLVDSGAY